MEVKPVPLSLVLPLPLLLSLATFEVCAADNTPLKSTVSNSSNSPTIPVVQQMAALSESANATSGQTEVMAQQFSSQALADNDTWLPQDSDLRILEIRVDSYTFEDVIGAYQYQDIILLPLGALATILDIAIDVGADSASGFVIKEENTFLLDTSRNEVILKGIIGTYNNDLVKILDDDIYVDASLMGDWLNMKFDVDLYGSRVWVRSELKLPFLARIERERRIAKSLSTLNRGKQQYPRHHEAYKNYTLPFLDQTLSINQRYSDTGDDTTVLSTTHATADLFQHESSWYLTMNDQDGVDDFRVTLGRTDPEGTLLGPMNAREYKFGHVSEPRIGLINVPSNLEYGAVVSSYPVGRQNEYDRHRFMGELLPGWEVELYRNNALIGYQQTATNGQYDFQDVPLLFGNNHFRLVFYGPRGEIRETSKQFQPSQAMTKKGEHYYRASTITDEMDEQRSTVQYDYGVSKQLSTTLSFVSIPLQEPTGIVQHNYLGAGLTGYWDALLASATVFDDSESGDALEIDLQTRINSTTIGFKDIHLNQFVSEEYLPGAQEISRSSEVKINTAIPPSFLPRIPVTLGYKRDQFVTGGELVTINNQLSMSTRGVAITNQLTHQQLTDQQATASGSFRVSSNINKIRFRSTLSYTLEPESELTNIALTLDPGKYKDYRLSFGLNHSLQQDLTEYSATAAKLSGKYGLSFGARYNTNNDINLSLNLSFGFGYEPRRERWEPEARSVANMGSVSSRFFIDSNQDGIFDSGDEPIEDVGLRVNGGYSKGRSDEDGILFLTGIPAHQSTNITIAPETLIDPLWGVALDGVQIVPRPGHAIQIDFPIFMSGEIDGTVYLRKNGREFGVGDVEVELVDANNRVIATTKTAYDGFYILSKAPIGDYRVRVSEEQLSTLGLQSSAGESLTIQSDAPFISGIDFTLEAIK
ncbi:MAG: carboxypeptidase-like regulatory domain-containing protein [Pseudomonadota bacterium]